MLNCIKIQGFKCFREAEIHFSNFTLLAGKNSTGKSTVIEVIKDRQAAITGLTGILI
ncbi:AAA family ATPase [Otoolea muris]|uniref:AAA family ATPase n=1 Tax=Otoolea muris TaxID=2941515 RepID=UPI003A7F50C5